MWWFISFLFDDCCHLVEPNNFLATKHGSIIIISKNVDVVKVAVGILKAFLNKLLFFFFVVCRAAVLYLTQLTLMFLICRSSIPWEILPWCCRHWFVLVIHDARSTLNCLLFADISLLSRYIWWIGQRNACGSTFNSPNHNVFVSLSSLMDLLPLFHVWHLLLFWHIIIVKLKLLVYWFLRQLVNVSFHVSYCIIG